MYTNYSKTPLLTQPAFNTIPQIKHTNFGPKKLFYSYLFIGNNENLNIEFNFDQSLEMRYSGVLLYDHHTFTIYFVGN